jgi:hypothetical protein
MYRPSHPSSYPRVEAMIDLGLALWHWLSGSGTRRAASRPALH